MELTSRQQEMLKGVVEEFMQSAEPAGSRTVVEKYLPKVSSATVRNEMVRLTNLGFLHKPHASSGRIPTSTGLRLYIRQLMEEQTLPVLEEVAIKQRLWQERFEFERLLRHTALALAEVSGNLGLAIGGEDLVIPAGAANILEHPEFFDIGVTRAALSILDHAEALNEIFNRAGGEDEVRVLIGEEMEVAALSRCGLVFMPFEAGRRSGKVAVLGPDRMTYKKIIPLVRYVGGLLSEIGKAW